MSRRSPDGRGWCVLDEIEEQIWGALDRLEQKAADILTDPTQWSKIARSVGARILEDKAALSPLEQLRLREAGRKLQTKIEALRRDPARRARQEHEMARLARRKITRLNDLARMDPGDFEFWVANYFQRHRYRDILVTPISGDFGVDIYMTCPDRALAVAQVKRYDAAVGRPVVQQTFGVMVLVGARRSIVAASGDFSSKARELQAERKDILLVDGRQLLAG